ncbi:MAG: phosphotransferase [Anaerolineae bacterium]|nr:phosphotransferase [Anaerolineae bacterium]
MQAHPYFDLRLHSDLELETLLQSEIAERETIHEWPLSCVQRLVMRDGRRYAYKSQRPPSVEAQFYRAARSALLAGARILYDRDGHACLLIDWIDAPRIEELQPSPADTLAIAREVSAQIGAIAGRLPTHLDIGSPAAWRRVARETIEELRNLIARGRFSIMNCAAVASLERDAASDPVLALVSSGSGYVHGDLAGDNLFVTADGYRVIDWQRPLLGPPELHAVTLLHSLGHDPIEWVAPAAVWLQSFLSVRWLTRCAAEWFPQGMSYDGQVADLAAGMAGLLGQM